MKESQPIPAIAVKTGSYRSTPLVVRGEPGGKEKGDRCDRRARLNRCYGGFQIGAGTATIALAGAAVGIGKIFSSLIHSVARSPELDTKLFGYAILGFALTEAIALFALMMAFLIFFVF
ncbi:unnamed protein product [Lactuca virosa]|uniref:ATP synthase subunit 9, mitochondrial n=1 Tax=Lactuca virosa TaxID=75947 RepID=A0AAU9N679_9ASTR|nr:unnamed protein product [Lactuca virosa]